MAITAPPPGIFKAYDIRGVYGEELDAETAHLIGRAFARVLAGLRGKEPIRPGFVQNGMSGVDSVGVPGHFSISQYDAMLFIKLGWLRVVRQAVN